MGGSVRSRREKPPRVIALVVHFGSPAPTRACLADLARSPYPDLDVMVVDNDPENRIDGEIRGSHPAWRILSPSRNLGYCRAMNMGLREVFAGDWDYALFLNNDTRLPGDFLTPLVEAMEGEERAGSAGPRVLDPEGRIWSAGGVFAFGPNITWLRGHRQRGENLFTTPDFVDYFPGACVLHRVAALRAAGRLVEDYWMYMEDLDLALRMREKGFLALYVPWARVVHDPSSSTGGGVSATRKYLTALNSIRFLKRHGTPRRWLAFWLYDVLGLPLAGLAWLARGEGFAPARAKARGLLHGFLGRRAGEEVLR